MHISNCHNIADLRVLAAGANACSVRRAYLYGLAAGGQAGVEQALTILQSEFERTLALVGRNSVTNLGRDCVQLRGKRRQASRPLPASWPCIEFAVTM
ncbi:MAG TPA: alpha-hydroxy-acid oxidizing protein [Woeseiaceae bacterium]|nr:alpha-hydroxy-acid oxidizing protein [Woeseiaceae bacterium]